MTKDFDFAKHLARQAAHSLKTFGPGKSTLGITDHIRKELLEIEADPDDAMEWIDIAILALDGAWRCGLTPEQIINMLVTKQTKNEGRNWPDWRTVEPGKAIEHIRSDDIICSGCGYEVDQCKVEYADCKARASEEEHRGEL